MGLCALFTKSAQFEIRDLTGALVARAVNMGGTVPVSDFSLSSFSSLRAYSMETPVGVRIGELRGPVMLIPNRPYLEITDANGQVIAIIMMRVEKKLSAGFLSGGITTWVIASPSGEELAKINWGGAGQGWTVETPEGATIAEVQRFDEPHDTYEVKILNPAIDPYVLLATFFATPPGTK